MEEIAEVYARSLFEVANEHDVLDRVHDELGEFAEALDQDRTLQVFLFSPYFSSEEKYGENRNTWRVRSPSRASANSPSSSCTRSSTSCSMATSNSERA